MLLLPMSTPVLRFSLINDVSSRNHYMLSQQSCPAIPNIPHPLGEQETTNMDIVDSIPESDEMDIGPDFRSSTGNHLVNVPFQTMHLSDRIESYPAVPPILPPLEQHRVYIIDVLNILHFIANENNFSILNYFDITAIAQMLFHNLKMIIPKESDIILVGKKFIMEDVFRNIMFELYFRDPEMQGKLEYYSTFGLEQDMNDTECDDRTVLALAEHHSTSAATYVISNDLYRSNKIYYIKQVQGIRYYAMDRQACRIGYEYYTCGANIQDRRDSGNGSTKFCKVYTEDGYHLNLNEDYIFVDYAIRTY